MAAKKKTTKAKEAVGPWKPNVADAIDEVSKSVGLTPMSLQRGAYIDNAVSTGLLVYDLAVGGGFAPGRFCGQYGPEAGGKSTACASSIAQAQQKGIESFFFDHEGSADAAYWGRIGVNLYGDFRSEEAQAEAGTDAGFKAGPHLHYYAPQTAEMSLKFMSRLLQKMPDKRIFEDQWYFFYPGMKQTEATKQGIPFDTKVTRKLGGGVWIPAEDGSAQAIFYIDSIASMRPEALVGEKKKGEYKDESGAQALLARVLASNLPAVTSAMVEKRITIVATNQLRQAPGVQFGNPDYAPGGNAIKHAHDNRVKLAKRAVPAGWTKAPGGVCVEKCWDGKGEDKYTFAKLTSEKCKDFMPHKTAWIRWWFDNNGRPGPGIDPVFDTFQYLKMTGQLHKAGTKWEVALPGSEFEVDSAGFKALILDPEHKDEVRQGCWDQMRNGDGFERFFDTDQSEDA